MSFGNISFVGLLHTGLTALAFMFACLLLPARKGTPRHRRLGRAFVISLGLGSALALTIYRRNVFYFPHWAAVAAIVTIAVGWMAAHWRRPARWWKEIHVSAMIFAVYDIAGGFINEMFLRIPLLNEHRPDIWLGIAQMLALAGFALLLACYLAPSIRAHRRA